MFDSNTNEILKLMRKGLKQKKQIVRQRREDSYDERVNEWKSKGGSVDRMSKDSHWGYSSPRSNIGKFIGKEPKRLSESQKFWNELDQLIEELERD